MRYYTEENHLNITLPEPKGEFDQSCMNTDLKYDKLNEYAKLQVKEEKVKNPDNLPHILTKEEQMSVLNSYHRIKQDFSSFCLYCLENEITDEIFEDLKQRIQSNPLLFKVYQKLN